MSSKFLNEEENFKAFVEVIRNNNIIDLGTNLIDSWSSRNDIVVCSHATSLKRVIYRRKDETKNEGILAYIAPISIEKFPSLFASKQSKGDCPRVLLCRLNDLETSRRDFIVKKLLAGDQVCLLGLPGVSKTTETNVIFIELVQKMDYNSLRVVAYRVGAVIYEVTMNAENELTYKTYPGGDLCDVTSYSLKYSSSKVKPILLLEMDENESDPGINIPYYVTLSIRNINSRAKTLDKSGGIFLLTQHIGH